MAREAKVERQRQWRDRLRRFTRSKLSVAEFCRREGVSVPSFYHWRKKLRATGRVGDDAIPTTEATFLPVQVATSGNVQVAFPNGVTLTLPIEEHALIKLCIEVIAQTRTNMGDT